MPGDQCFPPSYPLLPTLPPQHRCPSMQLQLTDLRNKVGRQRWGWHFMLFQYTCKVDQLAIKGPNYMFMKRTQLCLCPIQTDLEAPEGFPVKTKMKADTKLTVVMCCQIFIRGPQHHLAAFSGGAGAAAGLFTEPQTAAGIVSFLQIQPVYVFFKLKIKKKSNLNFLDNLLPQLFSYGFHAPFLFVKDV